MLFYWPFKDRCSSLRIHWRLLTILKINNKSAWSDVFWYVKIFIPWKFIQYTKHWDKTHMSKNFPLNKINVTKNEFFFLLQPYHRFAFNSWFLHELKHKVYLSRSVLRFLHFQLRLFLCFGSMKNMDSLTLKRHNSFQN